MPFMRNAWYRAVWDHEVTRAPRARRILDIPVLLFRKQDGAVAIGDRCSHRFAPLSAGVVRGIKSSVPTTAW